MASDATPNAGAPGTSLRLDSFHYQEGRRYEIEGSSESSDIEQLRRELEDAHQRIERDTGLIDNLHEKVTELEELVRKQRITINTQSRAISDRRVVRKSQQQQQSSVSMGMYPMTPSHHYPVHQCQYLGSGASGVSCSSASTCVGNGTSTLHSNAFSPFEAQALAQAQIQTPQSVRSTEAHCSTIFDQPPPKFEIPSTAYPAHTSLAIPSIVKRKESKDVFSPMAPSSNNGVITPALSAPISPDHHKEMAGFSTRFQALMRMSEVFGQTHASIPNIYNDSHMEDTAKEYLMAISCRSRTSHLLEDAATRGFLVAKAINWYLVEMVLKVDVITGFDTSVDGEIEQIQRQMAFSSANNVKIVSKAPTFSSFISQKTTHHLTKLWPYIAPLGHDAHQNSSMWADLHAIVAEAHALAVNMLSIPLEYRFEFPEQAEPFDPSTMINRDPYVHGDPQALKNTPETRVRLGVTPTVRIRDSSKSGENVNLMYLGHVLLKQPPRKQVS
ncbi:uncharacterized protein BDV14DRAFT_195036 [Aspergillus stella-maris]|uniref:uncharacterized protein n=1 Tax=Aspergillus stella-maris TaxID=1810926 RepID=UPI003CCD78B7